MKRIVLLIGIVAVTVVLLVGLRDNGSNRQAGTDERGGASVERHLTGDETAQPRAPTPRLADDDRGPLRDSDACRNACGSECWERDSGQLECPPTCLADAECPVGTSCVLAEEDAVGGRYRRCLASNCAGDQDCAPEQTCRFQGRQKSGAWRCEPAGGRQVSQTCTTVRHEPQSACAHGLVCVRGRCAPTECSGSEDCPPGTTCAPVAGAGHMMCAPTCASSADCMAGDVCVSTGAVYQCVPEVAVGCLRSGCPDGTACHIDSDLAWDFRTSCRRLCSPGKASGCDAGERCRKAPRMVSLAHTHYCDADCARSGASCPDGFECIVSASGSGRCKFDQRRAAAERQWAQ